jgi:hypothetical protein
MRYGYLLVVLVVAGGCTVEQEAPPPARWVPPVIEETPEPGYATEILTEPPGAHIEIDSEYIGPSPVTLTFDQVREDFPPGCVLRQSHDIRALPAAPGQYVQSHRYPCGAKVPHKIFFNMHVCPLPGPPVILFDPVR